VWEGGDAEREKGSAGEREKFPVGDGMCGERHGTCWVQPSEGENFDRSDSSNALQYNYCSYRTNVSIKITWLTLIFPEIFVRIWGRRTPKVALSV
jgi:hypothetical protein